MTSREHGLVALALALALLLAPAVARGTPPANDNLANAAPLPLGADIAATNIDASAETGEPNPAGAVKLPNCAAADSNPNCATSVWYRITPSFTGTYTFETCDGGTDVDTVIAVYTGSTLGSLSELTNGDNDDACIGGPSHNASQVSVSLTAGTTYDVEVAGFAADQGSFYLHAYEGGPASGPEPDTFIENEASFRSGKFGLEQEPVSGPRQTPSFAFTSDQPGASFQCSVDGVAFTGCTSPVSLDATPGAHVFAVRSVVSGSPDPTPAIQHFTVDNTPPGSIFLAGPLSTTSNTNVGWVVAPNEREVVPSAMSSRCSLDAQPLTGCSLDSTSYIGLCTGAHTFTAAAVDQAGNIDPTPLSQTVSETGGVACAAPHLGTITPTAVGPTEESIAINVGAPGEGGLLRADFGTTTAYGSARTSIVQPNTGSETFTLRGLRPNTTYHYKVTVTTASGSDSSGDATFTTNTLGAETLPAVNVGTPVTVGHYAVSIPMTIKPGNVTTDYGAVVDDGPLTQDSPRFDGLDTLSGSSADARSVQLVDLQPGATYHVSAFASDANHNFVFSPETTFTMPPLPVTPPPVTPSPLPAVHPFKLRSGFVKVGKIRRGSMTITLLIRHLPSGSSANVVVNDTLGRAGASKTTRLGKGHAKAGKNGVARVKIKLSRKARRLLRSKRSRSLSLKVTVKPPGDESTSVTLRRKLGH